MFMFWIMRLLIGLTFTHHAPARQAEVSKPPTEIAPGPEVVSDDVRPCVPVGKRKP